MVPSLRHLLLGSPGSRPRWHLELLVAVPVFVGVFAAYALGVFEVTGGVVVLPGDATSVGLAVALLAGYLGRGLLLAWLALYAALLGSAADHYFLGLSGRSFLERAAAFLGPDGLAFMAIAALALGTLAWLVGELGRWAVDSVRGGDGAMAPE